MPLRERVVRVAVEGADERHAASSRARPSRRSARPARGRGRRRSARAQLLAQRRDARTASGEVRDRAVGREARSCGRAGRASRASRAPPGARRDAAAPSGGRAGRRARGPARRGPRGRSSLRERLDVPGHSPGYVHEYGDTSAMRIARMLATLRRVRAANPQPARVIRASPSTDTGLVRPYPGRGDRHFVKYTFLQVDPAWRRLDAAPSAREHKREFLAACEDFGDRPPAAELLARRHPRRRRPDARRRDREPRPHPRVPRRARAERADEVVHAALLVPRACARAREYSEDKRLVPRPFRGKYLFVYPFVKTRAVVRAAGRGALADDAGPHPDRRASTRRSTTTRRTRSASTTRSSSSPSTPTTSARSSTSCSGCAAPRRRPTRCATRRSFTCIARVARAGAQRARRRADPGARAAWRDAGRDERARAPARRRPGARAACSTSYGPPDLRATRARPAPGDHYGALVRSIVGQQLSVNAARAIYGAAARALRRPRADAGGGPRRRPRGAARRGRAVAREGRVPALAGRARRLGRARARPPRTSSSDEEVMAELDRGQGHRRVDRAHVPDVPARAARRPRRRRPRRSAARSSAPTASPSCRRRPSSPRSPSRGGRTARAACRAAVALARQHPGAAARRRARVAAG